MIVYENHDPTKRNFYLDNKITKCKTPIFLRGNRLLLSPVN